MMDELINSKKYLSADEIELIAPGAISRAKELIFGLDIQNSQSEEAVQQEADELIFESENELIEVQNVGTLASVKSAPANDNEKGEAPGLFELKAEIFDGVQRALELDKSKLMNYIYARYGVPKDMVEEMFYDACSNLSSKYLKGAFDIEHSEQLAINTSEISLPLITSEKVVTSSGYSVEEGQLMQAQSWVWKSVKFKALDYLKRDNRFSDRSISESQDFLPLEESSNRAETYGEDDTVNSIMNLMEAHDEDQLKEVSSIISSTIMGMRSNRERDVVNLIFYSDMSTREIADHLEISISNVRSIKGRGLNRIKKQLVRHPQFQGFSPDR